MSSSRRRHRRRRVVVVVDSRSFPTRARVLIANARNSRTRARVRSTKRPGSQQPCVQIQTQTDFGRDAQRTCEKHLCSPQSGVFIVHTFENTTYEKVLSVISTHARVCVIVFVCFVHILYIDKSDATHTVFFRVPPIRPKAFCTQRPATRATVVSLKIRRTQFSVLRARVRFVIVVPVRTFEWSANSAYTHTTHNDQTPAAAAATHIRQQ